MENCTWQNNQIGSTNLCVGKCSFFWKVGAIKHNWRAHYYTGIIFADDANVVPDVIWISQERLKNSVAQRWKNCTTRQN